MGEGPSSQIIREALNKYDNFCINFFVTLSNYAIALARACALSGPDKEPRNAACKFTVHAEASPHPETLHWGLGFLNYLPILLCHSFI